MDITISVNPQELIMFLVFAYYIARHIYNALK